MMQSVRRLAAVFVLCLGSVAAARVENRAEFAPTGGLVQPSERPLRDELCLNGSWQFQQVDGTAGLPEPTAAWDSTPLKVPSPWNVNAWGTGADSGPGTGHPYWPTSVYFPSYPPRWMLANAGWLRRTFRVPWADGKRSILHFDAVAGECVVRVNGRPAGGHFDSYTPFELDVTDLLRPGDNELLVGVRSHRLSDVRSATYPKMRAPYPVGSETERLVGVWQDVFLLGLPPVHVTDAFVRPDVDHGNLSVDVTVRNDTDRPRLVQLRGEVRPWVSDGLDRGASRSHLGPRVLPLSGNPFTVPAHGSATATVQAAVNRELKLWTPAEPNLYAAVVGVQAFDDGSTLDVRQVRFGWRQWSIRGVDLLLNGTKLQLVGDLLHPFGPFTLSPRYAWAWYTLVKEMGGNAIRLHAQPMPRFYLDLADEMGVAVLGESALFGSSVALNFEPPVAWQRFADHLDGLVRRDRNHPSVMGWSIGNELFAVFDLNHVAKADADRWYGQLAELAGRVRTLDPTRPWVSCDGDDDLRGTLPVHSKHFGAGLPDANRLPDVGKPLMVGESGGSYYARPAQLAEFAGDLPFASYAGRNDALAVDVYDNLVHLAKPRLAYFSASETAWFGVEHLPYGYAAFDRLPTADDGVWFTAPFAEGKPGIQLEHLPPYVATLNPGWDPSLPTYRPLAMFDAERAALAGEPCRWDHRLATPPPAAARPPTIDRVAFDGDRSKALYRRLLDWGVPVVDEPAPLTVVEGDTVAEDAGFGRGAAGTTKLVFLDAAVPRGLDLTLTDRPATALVPDPVDPWTASFTLPQLYFAEQPADARRLLRHGLAGPAVDRGRVLLRASDTDWSTFNDAPEVAKCGATVLVEHLRKPGGAALVAVDDLTAVCSLDYHVATPAADAFWRHLLTNLGVTLRPARLSVPAAFDEHGALATAQVTGRLPPTAPLPDRPRWAELTYANRDRFLLDRVDPDGPVPFAVYVSYWVNSPRALDDVLTAGPDVPRYETVCYAAERCSLTVNGAAVAPSHTEPADYRTRSDYAALPLRRGWNHVVIRVEADRVRPDQPPTLAVRAHSDDAAFWAGVTTAATDPTANPPVR